jgi:hypothetical protein
MNIDLGKKAFWEMMGPPMKDGNYDKGQPERNERWNRDWLVQTTATESEAC